MTPTVLFLQRRPHRAGAQTCLFRLISHEAARAWRPRVLCSEAGWLTRECAQAGVPAAAMPFPSSRSLAGRLYRNAAFVRRVRRASAEWSCLPSIVQANDHGEGVLGLRLARAFRARSAIVLRSSQMTAADYAKYRCGEHDLVLAVGDELRDRVKGWDPGREVIPIHDGIGAQEFLPPKPKPAQFPRRLLVLGSPLALKGWAELSEALHRLQERGELPELELDFTGDRPDPTRNPLHLERLTGCRCTFLGRTERFADLVRGYDLAISPSRMESFGMAAVETVAFGVPLLSSRTGIIDRVIGQAEFLFPPSRPEELAAALRHLIRNWASIDFDAGGCQRRIRERFLIDRAVDIVGHEYARLLRRGRDDQRGTP